MCSEQDAQRAITLYADMVRRICLLHLKNHADMEDIFQEVFLKYALHSVAFESVEHEKAWLIRVTLNACRDLLKSFFRRKTISLEEALDQSCQLEQESIELLEIVTALPPKYKDVIYLYYYEGYSAKEIADLLRKKENTIYSLLSRARAQIKEVLEEENIES